MHLQLHGRRGRARADHRGGRSRVEQARKAEGQPHGVEAQRQQPRRVRVQVGRRRGPPLAHVRRACQAMVCANGSFTCQCVLMWVLSSLTGMDTINHACPPSRAASASLELGSVQQGWGEHRGEAVQGGAGGKAAPGDAAQGDGAAVDGLHDGVVARSQRRRRVRAAACAPTGRARASSCAEPGCVDAGRLMCHNLPQLRCAMFPCMGVIGLTSRGPSSFCRLNVGVRA